MISAFEQKRNCPIRRDELLILFSLSPANPISMLLEQFLSLLELDAVCPIPDLLTACPLDR